jgi:mannose-6-phosphate isomerase-like protein (cupin superfamily)
MNPSPLDRVVVIPGEGEGPELAIVDGPGTARAVVWPGMGAVDRSVHRIRLREGGRTIPLAHPSEAVYYVVAGSGKVVDGAGAEQEIVPGSFVHVQPESTYSLVAGDAEIELAGGPCPPDPALYEDGLTPASGAGGGVQILHRDRPERMLPMIAKDARLLVWPGVGAQTATMNYVNMAEGEANVPHSHPESEDTLVVLSGRGSVDDLENGFTVDIEAGQVLHIPRALRHCVRANRGSHIESVGGPSPADMGMLGTSPS